MTQDRSITLWIESKDEQSGGTEIRLVYPQAALRVPPEEGLSAEETRLYKEAAAVELSSRRAACALLRVLLEALLKRYLTEANQSVKNKSLAELIELAVKHLELSPTLQSGLTAIRERGNLVMHDPYGLTDDTRSEELPWLFQAVDQLVHDLHVTPKRWDELANP